MPEAHEELSRFNGGGKTFFFNKRTARNDTDYLAINAMYGQGGNYEKIVLFPQHLLEFSKHLDEAIEELTGFTRPCQCGSIVHPTNEEEQDG